jgi:hypothetical protein
MVFIYERHWQTDSSQKYKRKRLTLVTAGLALFLFFVCPAVQDQTERAEQAAMREIKLKPPPAYREMRVSIGNKCSRK